MIKVNELRIGNWVYECIPPTISPVQIWGIKPDRRNHMMINDVEIEAIEPIELTVEWLEKFGFEKCAGGYYYKKFNEDYNIYVSPQNWIELGNGFDDDVFLTQCDYVHQLQNLWFSLKGEELEYDK